MSGRFNLGRWMKEEHEAFLCGVALYHQEWDLIATIVTTRSVLQIRTHGQKYFKKLKKGQVFPQQPYESMHGNGDGTSSPGPTVSPPSSLVARGSSTYRQQQGGRGSMPNSPISFYVGTSFASPERSGDSGSGDFFGNFSPAHERLDLSRYPEDYPWSSTTMSGPAIDSASTVSYGGSVRASDDCTNAVAAMSARSSQPFTSPPDMSSWAQHGSSSSTGFAAETCGGGGGESALSLGPPCAGEGLGRLHGYSAELRQRRKQQQNHHHHRISDSSEGWHWQRRQQDAPLLSEGSGPVERWLEYPLLEVEGGREVCCTDNCLDSVTIGGLTWTL